MKKWSFKIYPVTLVFCCLFFRPVAGRAEISLLARVGGEAITSSDLQDIIRSGESREAILERLVEERLLFLEARKQKVKISQKDINGEYERIMGLFPDPVQFYRRLREESLTPAVLRRRIERQITVRRFVQAEVLAKIRISPKELEVYLQEHRDELTLQVSEVRLSEAVFTALAEIPEKRSAIEEKMKDIGSIPFPELSEEIQKAISGLAVGEFSQTILFEGAYVIFKVTEIKTPAVFNPSSLVLTAKQRLSSEKYAAAYRELVNDLKKKTEVKYYLDESE